MHAARTQPREARGPSASAQASRARQQMSQIITSPPAAQQQEVLDEAIARHERAEEIWRSHTHEQVSQSTATFMPPLIECIPRFSYFLTHAHDCQSSTSILAAGC